MMPMLLFLAVQVLPSPGVPAAEEPIVPYAQADANAGATPFRGDAMWHAFHRQAGVDRIVDGMIRRNTADRRIRDIFKGHDMVRLHRVLKEQFCYILGGGCHYSGRSMRGSHTDMGVQDADMAALVENLQAAMREEGVSFPAQNRFLAKLAPMRRDVVKVKGTHPPT